MPLVPPFPFEPLPPGKVTPWSGPGDLQELLRRDIHIVRWFVEQAGWMSTPLNAESTLGQYMAACEKLDLSAAAPTVEELDQERARYLLHASAALERLAWAVRALHGNGGAVDRVDASFIRDELLGDDSKEKTIEKKLPAGVGTLVFAGRLVQAGRGRVCINGHGGVGHDIEWKTGDGDVVLVERKDRSYEAGLVDTLEKRVRRVVEYTRTAGLTMPRRRGAARVLVVGFQHLVQKGQQREVDRAYWEALMREFGRGRVRAADLPHLVVVEHLGLEPKTNGAKVDFFSPHALSMKPRDLMYRVGRLVVRALGRNL